MGFAGWARYRESFSPGFRSSGQGSFPDLGTFSLVRYYQHAVDKTKGNMNFASKFSPIPPRTGNMEAFEFRSDEPSSPSPMRQGKPTFVDANSLALKPEDLDVALLNIETPARPAREMVPPSSRILKVSAPASAADSALFPVTEDEQIVNTALLLFLNAVTMHFEIDADWTLHRRAFKLGIDGAKSFEARVDGYLRHRKTDRVHAIVEVKPCIRDKKITKIQMQESAQMAAWICNDPGDYESYRKSKESMK